jgi:hypothetical protein
MSDSLLMLLEMIEEVLEEQKVSPQSILDNIKATLRNKSIDFEEPVSTSKNGNQFKIHLTNTFDREAVVGSLSDEMEKIVLKLDKEHRLEPYFSSGRLIGQTIRQDKRAIFFRYQLKPKGGINESEEMEKIIANATRPKDAILDDIKPGFDDSGQKLNAMRSSIDGLGLPPLKKQENANGPSSIYVKFGATSKVPKTDLIDKTEQNKFSVKKDGGAQFVSAQGPESAALWHIALDEAKGGIDEASINAALQEIPDLIKKQFSYDNFKVLKESDLTSKLKAEIYSEFGETLFEKIIEGLNLDATAFKKAFVEEGMTGNIKFGEKSPSSANKVLTWPQDLNEKVTTDTIDKYIDNNIDNMRLRVSDRGGERGGAIRGDILKKRTLEENIIIEIVDEKQRDIIRSVREFIKSNNITPQQMNKILQFVEPMIKERAESGQWSSSNPLVKSILKVIDQEPIVLDLLKGYAKGGDEYFNSFEEPSDESLATEQQYETFVDNLANEYKELINVAFNGFEGNALFFLDYLRPYEEEKIDMIPFYKQVTDKGVKGIEIGEYEPPNKYIPTKGYNNRMLEGT